jgi:hypothetical protein
VPPPKIGPAPWVDLARPGERYYPIRDSLLDGGAMPSGRSLVCCAGLGRRTLKGHAPRWAEGSVPSGRVPTHIIGAARHPGHHGAAVARIGSVTDRYLTATAT